MFIDIAANLTDEMFQGTYHGKKIHEPDLGHVIDRAISAKCEKMIVLAGTINDAYKCLDICNTFDPECKHLFTTVGFHPLRSSEANCADENMLNEISKFIEIAGPDRVVALGELGLDYHRLEFSDKETQMRIFELQLRVATRFPQLPLLLHLRNAFDDFLRIIKEYPIKGVVHSFTGTTSEMQTLVQSGLYIGVNGCTLRDAIDVVPHIPEDRLIFETDAPYCEMRPTHPGYGLLAGLELPKTLKPEKFQLGSHVKGRNEPACINQVASVVAAIRKTDSFSLSEKVRLNTIALFRKLARYSYVG